VHYWLIFVNIWLPWQHRLLHKNSYSIFQFYNPETLSHVKMYKWETFVVVFIVFSERELAFTFAICRRASVCRLSVCRTLSVCNVHAPYSSDWNFPRYCYIIRKVIYPSFLRRRMDVGATPSTWNFGSTNPRWSEMADFRPIFARSSSAITPGEKSSINTNRKS